MGEMRRRQAASGGFSLKRLTPVRALLEGHFDSGFVPGIVPVLARRGEVHVEATGTLAFEGAGSRTPMAADTICRLASMTKPIVAACAMALVEDGTLSLDDPVDDFLPELGDMTVLVDPGGPLEETVAAKRPITLRDLLTFTLGTGMVPAQPGTVPIADVLDALGQPPLDGRWSRPPAMESGSGGLVSTAEDYLNFASVLLAGGAYRGGRLLSQESVTLMTSDQLTPQQKAACGFGPRYLDAMGWGFGMSVITRRTNGGLSVGSYGWPGMYGTAWYNDPAEDLAAIVMMQRSHAGNQQLPMWHDFWAAVCEAID